MLEVAGSLVHAESEGFRAALEEMSRGATGNAAIVDLGALEYISSASMRLLVQYERSLAENGIQMITAGLKGLAREAMEISGIDLLLTTAPTVRAALEMAKAR